MNCAQSLNTISSLSNTCRTQPYKGRIIGKSKKHVWKGSLKSSPKKNLSLLIFKESLRPIYSRMLSVFSCTMSVFSRLSARTKAPCSTVSSSIVAALSCSPVLSSLHAPWACGCSKLLTVATMACGSQIIDLVKSSFAGPGTWFDMVIR